MSNSMDVHDCSVSKACFVFNITSSSLCSWLYNVSRTLFYLPPNVNLLLFMQAQVLIYVRFGDAPCHAKRGERRTPMRGRRTKTISRRKRKMKRKKTRGSILLHTPLSLASLQLRKAASNREDWRKKMIPPVVIPQPSRQP